MRHWKKVIVILVTVAAAAAPADAAAILYTDRNTWLAALANLTATITFEGLASPGTPGDYSTASGLSLGGVRFVGTTSSGYFLYAQDPGLDPYLNWNSGVLLMGGQASWGASIRVALPAGVTAVGTDLMTHTPFAAPVVLSLSTGETFVVTTLNHPNRAFAGVASPAPISWIQLTPQSGYVLVDNFGYRNAMAATESDTLILAGTGVLGLWLARRRRRP